MPIPLTSLPALLQKDDILPPHLGEVIGHRCPHDSTPTDDHPGLGRQGDRVCLGSWRAASCWGPFLPCWVGALSSNSWEPPIEHHVCHQPHDVVSLSRNLQTRQKKWNTSFSLTRCTSLKKKRLIIIHSINTWGSTGSSNTLLCTDTPANKTLPLLGNVHWRACACVDRDSPRASQPS